MKLYGKRGKIDPNLEEKERKKEEKKSDEMLKKIFESLNGPYYSLKEEKRPQQILDMIRNKEGLLKSYKYIYGNIKHIYFYEVGEK